MTEATMVKQEIKEIKGDNSIDIDEKNIAEIGSVWIELIVAEN